MAELKIGPPPLPNRKKLPFVGTARLHGMIIDIENLKGSVREGPGWKTKMKFHYGELRKTEGTDGDKLDVYIGPNPESKRVFVVHQNHPGNHPKGGTYDEDKVMLGFSSPEDAKAAYLSQYNRKDFFRSMTELDLPKFKKMVFGEVKGAKVAEERKCAMGCATPGKKVRSKGQGRGKAFGAGKGPRGVALADKLREFAKVRKKDRPPSAFVRSKMKVGHSLKEAYYAGVKLALGEALTPVSSLAVAAPNKVGAKPGNLRAASLSKGAPAGSSEGTSAGAIKTG